MVSQINMKKKSDAHWLYFTWFFITGNKYSKYTLGALCHFLCVCVFSVCLVCVLGRSCTTPIDNVTTYITHHQPAVKSSTSNGNFDTSWLTSSSLSPSSLFSKLPLYQPQIFMVLTLSIFGQKFIFHSLCFASKNIQLFLVLVLRKYALNAFSWKLQSRRHFLWASSKLI